MKIESTINKPETIFDNENFKRFIEHAEIKEKDYSIIQEIVDLVGDRSNANEYFHNLFSQIWDNERCEREIRRAMDSAAGSEATAWRVIIYEKLLEILEKYDWSVVSRLTSHLEHCLPSARRL